MVKYYRLSQYIETQVIDASQFIIGQVFLRRIVFLHRANKMPNNNFFNIILDYLCNF